jgi:hypothetical protein
MDSGCPERGDDVLLPEIWHKEVMISISGGLAPRTRNFKTVTRNKNNPERITENAMMLHKASTNLDVEEPD